MARRTARSAWPAAALAAALLAAAGLGAGCGYGLAAGVRLRGGATRAEVRAFENRSSDPGLGAAVAAALRAELARRGAEGPGGAVIEGVVRTEGAAPTLPGGAAVRVVLEVEGRLVVHGEAVATRTVRREADHLGGADALEGEARRAQALQRLSLEAARALVDALEE